MVPKIADGPRKKKRSDDFWDEFEDDWDNEEEDFYNEGDWEEYEED